MRSWKLVLSLILILLLISAALSGCGKKEPEPALTGVWLGEIDLAPDMVSRMDEMIAQSGMNISINSYGAYLDSLPCQIRLELKEDGTYLQTMDEASLPTMKEILFESTMGYYRDFLREVLVSTLKSFGDTRDLSTDENLEAALGMTVDEGIEILLGVDLETYMHTVMDEMWEGMAGSVKSEGKYKVEKGKLFLSDSLDHDVDPEIYYPFTFHDNELTVEKPVDSEDNGLSSFYPIVYHTQ